MSPFSVIAEIWKWHTNSWTCFIFICQPPAQTRYIALSKKQQKDAASSIEEPTQHPTQDSLTCAATMLLHQLGQQVWSKLTEGGYLQWGVHNAQTNANRACDKNPPISCCWSIESYSIIVVILTHILIYREFSRSPQRTWFLFSRCSADPLCSRLKRTTLQSLQIFSKYPFSFPRNLLNPPPLRCRKLQLYMCKYQKKSIIFINILYEMNCITLYQWCLDKPGLEVSGGKNV